MDCINKKNWCLLYSVLLLISSSFICCQESEYDTQNKLPQDNENMMAWLCVPKEKCWYYSDKQLLDDYTEITKCSPDGKLIVCPPKIIGDPFCQVVKNLNESECKFKSDCWHYKKPGRLSGYEHDIPCTFSDNKMCCAPTWTKYKYKPIEDASRIAREKCNEYTKQIYEKLNVNSQLGKSPTCDTNMPYIFDDMNAEKGEFPHMAVLMHMKNNYVQWIFGGSLISKKFVLSAATIATHGTPNTVMLGAENFPPTHENTNAVYYTIVETFLHPEYDSNRANNDIALFKLNDTVEFNAYIRPICLSTSSLFLPTHSTAVVSGYGVPDTGKKWTGALMKTNMTIFDNERCISCFNGSDLYSLGINKDTILCAGSNGDNGKYVCDGDGGSPLQTLNGECMWEQHGIASVGFSDCSSNKQPELIFTRVSYYIDWIESIVWSSNE